MFNNRDIEAFKGVWVFCEQRQGKLMPTDFELISEARKQAEDIRDAARLEAESMHEKAVSETAAELAELRRIKQEVADFKGKLLATYREHQTLIGILESGAPEDDTVTEVKEEPSQPELKPIEEAPVERTIPHDFPDFSALELVEN